MSTTQANSTDPALAAAPGTSAVMRRVIVASSALAMLAVLVVGGGWWLFGRADTDPSAALTDQPYFTVKRGPLTISVLTSGTIQASEAVVLKSEVEGRTTILSIVEEGTKVQAGDVVIELDASDLEERRIDQELVLENARVNMLQAEENFKLAQKEALADTQKAEVELQLAQLDYDKYIKKEYTQQLTEARNTITIAEAELEQAADNLEWSRRLYEEGYITQNEYQADQLAHQRRQLELDVARSALDLLENYTHQRKLAELKSALAQKELNLAKVKTQMRSKLADAEINLKARRSNYTRQQDKMDRLNQQIAACRIVAPVSGMVVYATSASNSRWREDEPLAEGTEVRERQQLIRLPTAENKKAIVDIHESMLEKIRLGLPARIATEALQEQSFRGTVSKIAVLPDSTRSWLNPDLKVFDVEIDITGDTTELRPGTSCRAEIIVDQFDAALYVPVQSVLRVDGQPTVYLIREGRIEPRPVEVGMDNNRMVRIAAGLREGDRVLLAPPLTPSTVRQGMARRTRRDNAPDTAPDKAKQRQPTAPDPQAPPRNPSPPRPSKRPPTA